MSTASGHLSRVRHTVYQQQHGGEQAKTLMQQLHINGSEVQAGVSLRATEIKRSCTLLLHVGQEGLLYLSGGLLWNIVLQDFWHYGLGHQKDNRPQKVCTNNPQRVSLLGSQLEMEWLWKNGQVNWKKRSERRKHCTLAVVRRSQKILPRHRPSS